MKNRMSRQTLGPSAAARACWMALVGALAFGVPGSSLAASDDTPVLLPGALNARVHAWEVTINTRQVGTWEVLETQGGYWVDGAALREWRLLMPAWAKPLLHGGRLWWPLFAVPGYRAALDEARQTLVVDVVSAAFEHHQVTGVTPSRAKAAQPISAWLLNYDVSWTESRSASNTQSDRGLLTEVGWTSDWGVLLSTQVNRWQRSGDNEAQAKAARLETSWTRDWPDHGLRLRMGDSWTPASTWGRQAAFGGIQLGSNRLFGLPGAAMASPVLTGSALTPSTVELYVNDVLRQSVQVPAGPFSLSPITPLGGAGEARLVVRDVLGRETVINRPFFTSPMLLSPGQQDWSVEAGRLRQGFGVDAPLQGYDHHLLQGWLRRGLSDRMTIEARAQGGSGLSNLGVAMTMSAWDRALVEAAWASSSLQGRRGSAALIGVQHQGPRQVLGFRALASSPDYSEAGRSALERPSKWEASVNWRTLLDGGSAWGVTLASLRRHDSSEVNTGALSYTQRLPQRASLLWSASRFSYSGVPGSTPLASSGRYSHNLQVLLVMPLGGHSDGTRHLVTAQWTRPRDSQEARRDDALLGVNAPAGPNADWGWRVLGGQRAGQANAEAGLYRQTSPALIGLDAWVTEDGARALRGTLQGAWVLAEGRLFGASRVKESFALVEVQGHEGVGVSLDGPVLTRTDARGMALVPRLSAFQSSRIRLDPNDIPPEAEVETLEARTAAPWRSGVKLRFPVRDGRGALLGFTVAGDGPAPAGAVVTLEGDEREFIVGNGGRAFVTGLRPDTPRLATLTWLGKSCVVQVRWGVSESHDALTEGLPRLGPWHCPEVQP